MLAPEGRRKTYRRVDFDLSKRRLPPGVGLVGAVRFCFDYNSG